MTVESEKRLVICVDVRKILMETIEIQAHVPE
jgi:hypothetical protein